MVILICKKKIIISVFVIALSVFFIWVYRPLYFTVKTVTVPDSAVIVIDPGHGGVDGGTNINGILEKDINLSISDKLKTVLEEMGCKVIMTREEDISLDGFNNTSKSRHKRDLNERIGIINKSNAQLFLSIHVNYMEGNAKANGAIVFYSGKFEENKKLADCIQQELNNLSLNGEKRTAHNPQKEKYYILQQSKIPGAIIEIGFISNSKERQALLDEEFRGKTSKAIAEGVKLYLKQIK